MLAVQQLDDLRQLLLMWQLGRVNSRCCCTPLPAVASQLQQRLGTQQVASLTAAAAAAAYDNKKQQRRKWQ
jgi:hypothetical protein